MAAPVRDPVAEALQAIQQTLRAGEVLTAALLAELSPEERAAWEKSQERRRQRSQRTIPKDQ
jgi:hypothetical protein